MKQESSEPYRLLFPAGIACAALGVAPWILFRLGALSTYPIVFHGHLMFQGFMAAFISGFLMTAVPKMSGTEPCRRTEAAAAVGALLLQIAAAGTPEISALVFAVQVAVLLFFIGRRLRHRKQSPAAHFIFIPAGLISAFLGALLLAGASRFPPSVILWARLLTFQAFVLNPIVGLGSRLVPVLSRAPGALLPTEAGGPRRFGLLLITLNASFVIEAFLDKNTGLLLRAVALTWAAFVHFRVAAPMKPVTLQGLSLRLAVVFLTVPFFLIPFFPAYELHWLHLSYIGGMGLMTLMVAVRVVLAHGGHDFAAEKSSRGLLLVAILIPLIALARALSFGLNDFYGVIAVVAGVWLVALTTWWLTIGRKIENPFSPLRRRP